MKSLLSATALSIFWFLPSVAFAHGDHSEECHCQAGLPCECGPDCGCPNCDCDLPAADSCSEEVCRDKRDCNVSRVRRVVKRTTRTVHRVRAIRRKASRPTERVPLRWPCTCRV